MKYPPAVYELASKVDRLAFKQTMSWQEYTSKRFDRLEEILLRQAADGIAHAFVDKVLKHSRITLREEPEGAVFKLDAVAMTYDELLEFAYRAYAEGQSDGMRRAPPMVGLL